MRRFKLTLSLKVLGASLLLALTSCDVLSTRQDVRDAGTGYVTDPSRWGQVRFDATAIEFGGATVADRESLVEAIVQLHRAWLAQDIDGFRALLTEDVTRMSSGRLSYGATAAAEALSYEWEHFERPYGTLAMDFSVPQAELKVRGDTATALYWVNVHAGARWAFETVALMYQIFIREDNAWKLAHHADSWSVRRRLVDGASESRESFDFDYVYPVQDLTRAVRFYTPLLGEPEAITDTRASFNLEGVRFHLDGNTLDGKAEIRVGMPSGYAIFHVESMEAELERLSREGVSIVSGVKHWGPDEYVIAEDSSDNVFVILESIPIRDATLEQEPGLSIGGVENVPPDVVSTVGEIMTAYLRMNADALLGGIREGARWFDDTRSNEHAIYEGREAIEEALSTVWRTYDRGPDGLVAEMVIDGMRATAFAGQMVVSYEYRLLGGGPHSFKETALVTQIFEKIDGDWKLALSFISASNITDAMVKELDYTGYPVTRLQKAKRFYSTAMRLGTPYGDAGYWGFWARRAVFGIYRAVAARDGIPRPHKTNGYVSFWVHSAQQVHQYLKERGSNFPVIAALNGVSGVDRQPGYVQVVATDSEGNLVLFTEYPGH